MAGAPYKDLFEGRLWFTKLAETAERGEVVQEVERRLRELTLEMRGEMTPEERVAKSNMLTLLHDQRDVARGLPQSWEGELKLLEADGGYKASLAGMELPVGEHFPRRRILVVTPLSREARKAYFEASTQKKLLLYQGPAGTGKTETFKDTSYDIGFDCAVFNCSPGMTSEEVGGAIADAKGAGKKIVFDEANRLTPTVWEALADAAQEAGILVCCTWNGQVAPAPAKVQEMGVMLEFTVPPLELLCEVMLSMQGFVESEALGKKFVAFIEVLKGGRFGQKKHYDFGLRFIKTAIDAMGKVGKVQGFDDEAMVVGQVVLHSLYAKLDAAGRGELQGVVKESLGVEPALPEGSALTMLRAALYFRHGGLLLGVAPEEADACTAAIEELATKEGGEVARVPGSVTAGSVEEFAAAFESTLRAAVVEDKKVWVVIAVGSTSDQNPSVEPFMERLHTVLDDNKCFLAAGGERIAFQPETRVILLASDVETMSPASISRLGVVLAEGDKGW